MDVEKNKISSEKEATHPIHPSRHWSAAKSIGKRPVNIAATYISVALFRFNIAAVVPSPFGPTPVAEQRHVPLILSSLWRKAEKKEKRKKNEPLTPHARDIAHSIHHPHGFGKGSGPVAVKRKQPRPVAGVRLRSRNSSSPWPVSVTADGPHFCPVRPAAPHVDGITAD